MKPLTLFDTPPPPTLFDLAPVEKSGSLLFDLPPVKTEKAYQESTPFEDYLSETKAPYFEQTGEQINPIPNPVHSYALAVEWTYNLCWKYHLNPELFVVYPVFEDQYCEHTERARHCISLLGSGSHYLLTEAQLRKLARPIAFFDEHYQFSHVIKNRPNGKSTRCLGPIRQAL